MTTATVRLVPIDGFDYRVFRNGSFMGTLGVGFADKEEVPHLCRKAFGIPDSVPVVIVEEARREL